jgi:ABC-type sugar transport system permease subunit
MLRKIKSKKGQMGMGLLTGMLVAVMVFVMLSAFLPVIIQMLGTGKGSNSANCVGYVDTQSAGLYNYNASLSSDTITCSILNFTPGMLVISIVFAVIAGILSGRLSMGSPEPQQQYYPGQY